MDERNYSGRAREGVKVDNPIPSPQRYWANAPVRMTTSQNSLVAVM